MQEKINPLRQDKKTADALQNQKKSANSSMVTAQQTMGNRAFSSAMQQSGVLQESENVQGKFASMIQHAQENMALGKASVIQQNQNDQEAFKMSVSQRQPEAIQHLASGMGLSDADALMKFSENKPHRAIAAAAVPVDYNAVNPGGGVDMGTTDPPQNAIAPRYHLEFESVETEQGERFKARVVKDVDADEGDVDAQYIQTGTYYIQRRWMPDDELRRWGLDPDTTAPNNRLAVPENMEEAIDWNYVYVNIGGPAAQQSMQAENEHLSDIREAYRISIRGMDLAIDQVIAEMPLNGFVSEGEQGYTSHQAAEDAIFNKIEAKLPVGSQGNMGRNQGAWLQKYTTLADMTSGRDVQGWHTFVLRKSGFWYNNSVIKQIKQWILRYAERPETTREYLDVIEGPQMNIGTQASNTVIHF